MDHASSAPLLDVQNLTICTRVGKNGTIKEKPLVDSLSLRISPGERVGLIGESGSGKSLTALAIMGLLPDTVHVSGDIRVAVSSSPHVSAINMVTAPKKIARAARGRRIAIVFQEPMTALNPFLCVGTQVYEAAQGSRKEKKKHVLELFSSVGLPDPERLYRAYPHQLSGGQRQRVLLAIALASNPDLLICDEPTTALDTTVQKQIIALIMRLAQERSLGLLFITHDLALVSTLCTRILVLREGVLVESGDTESLIKAPQHPYTRMLLGAARTLALPSPVNAEATHAHDSRPSEVLLEAKGVEKLYASGRGLHALDVSITRGQRLGIVGESGSGKTTLLRLLAGLEVPTAGSVIPGGSDDSLRIHSVFQDPFSSFDPRMRMCDSLAEGLRTLSPVEKRDRVLRAVEAVHLPSDSVTRFPHEFSGGQRQRLSIARALVSRPDILFADEPVSALDVSVRAQIMDLFAELIETQGLTIVFVSHDLAAVHYICDTMLVLRNGHVVDSGRVETLYAHPTSEYTRMLIEATPTLAY